MTSDTQGKHTSLLSLPVSHNRENQNKGVLHVFEIKFYDVLVSFR